MYDHKKKPTREKLRKRKWDLKNAEHFLPTLVICILYIDENLSFEIPTFHFIVSLVQILYDAEANSTPSNLLLLSGMKTEQATINHIRSDIILI